MCTVTFLPLPDSGFILTSNRDESIDRKRALQPQRFTINNIDVIFPKDEHANGTWVVTSSNHFTLCLLNGAFEAHIPNPPYKKSRGLMVLDFFHFNNIDQFADNYDFKGIEPFTMVLVHSENENLQLSEIRWDGNTIAHSKLDAYSSHIWSSATLYSAEIIEKRKAWFSEWLLNNKKYSSDDILKFHHFGGTGDNENDLVMQRNNRKQTVSISCISRSKNESSFFYKDLLSERSNCKIYA